MGLWRITFLGYSPRLGYSLENTPMLEPCCPLARSLHMLCPCLCLGPGLPVTLHQPCKSLLMLTWAWRHPLWTAGLSPGEAHGLLLQLSFPPHVPAYISTPGLWALTTQQSRCRQSYSRITPKCGNTRLPAFTEGLCVAALSSAAPYTVSDT